MQFKLSSDGISALRTIKIQEVAGSKNLYGSVLGRKINLELRERISQDNRATALSFEGVERVDATFLREAVVRLIKALSPAHEIIVTAMHSVDHLDNLSYAAIDQEQPVTLLCNGRFEVLGRPLSPAIEKILDRVLAEKSLSSAQLAAFVDSSVQCASTNLAKLRRSGYITRVEADMPSGGVEYFYRPVGAELMQSPANPLFNPEPENT